MPSPSPWHILDLTPADRYTAQKPTSLFRSLHDQGGFSTAVCTTGQRTNVPAIGSDPQWVAEQRRRPLWALEASADPLADPDGGGGRGAAEVEAVGVEEPVGVADLAASKGRWRRSCRARPSWRGGRWRPGRSTSRAVHPAFRRSARGCLRGRRTPHIRSTAGRCRHPRIVNRSCGRRMRRGRRPG